MDSRVVMVTGSSKGIGAACVVTLLEKGHTVIGIARNPQPTREGFYPVALDLTNLEQTATTLQGVFAEHKVDAVISNAGGPAFGGLEQWSPSQLSQSIQQNLVQHMVVARLAMPILKTHQRSDLLFLGSESSRQSGKHGSVYAAAKFGIRGFAEALRQEGSAKGVRVSLINPGMVDTDFFQNQSFRPGSERTNSLQAADVAAAILNVLESPAHVVYDEVNLSPLKHVIKFGTKQ